MSELFSLATSIRSKTASGNILATAQNIDATRISLARTSALLERCLACRVRILLNDGHRLLRFVDIQLSERDGSVVVTFPTEPTKGHVRARVSLESVEIVEKEVTTESTSGFKLTLHTSGRINFDRQHDPIFVEPIWRISKRVSILCRRIARLDTLREFTRAISTDDFVMDVPENGVPLAVEIWLAKSAPVTSVADEIWLSFAGHLHLGIRFVNVESLIPPDLVEHTVNLFPERGTEDSQVVEEDIALVDFMELVQGRPGPWITGPNGDGVYRMIFPVQMRIPPLASIRAVDEKLETEILDQSTDSRTNRVQVRFKFRDRKTRQVAKGAVDVAEIVLDAEF